MQTTFERVVAVAGSRIRDITYSFQELQMDSDKCVADHFQFTEVVMINSEDNVSVKTPLRLERRVWRVNSWLAAV
ncbi:hypothetical protein E2C01_049236 [Portunus trituberculatus]|uniref:Uncharacterized protein n=1 Tax=Portunus trituberculatus TaxID=210409 RepID=A0A5B7GFI8_PORTR|nr:hypothetical protein [Portunus trituberculatus]